ncbi:MAG: glutamate--cysteine ligase [Proteobacteria bacterium]|nr:glutamate--cysteine ligase [Pseudomonadota bacterium]
MESILKQQLEQLVSNGTYSLLRGTLHGIEKEGLRVDYSGELSQKAHPEGLGSALTNSNITTDFSEALLELITPVFKSPQAAIHFLENLHRFTYSHLGDELIWAGSMPCHIPDAASIPIARFGRSNIGQLKHIYRVGLEHRYGRVMQAIAGIHYNFSLPDEFWRSFQEQQGNTETLQSFRSSSYFKMIRNFRRHSWLLLYLFGASPALCDSFMKGKSHKLQPLHDHTLYLPYATSLRMSDIGYSTNAQSSLHICFNQLSTYIDSLDKAIHTSYPPYEKIGVKVDGKYRQLNTAILQIENEYYSDIRPKRVARSGERPLQTLRKNGVEYLEVRNTDINPFLPVGIDIQQALFFDSFLISCLLMSDEDLCPTECRMVNDNLHSVTIRGREPGLLLATPKGEVELTEAGKALLVQIHMTGELLDHVHETKAYSISVNDQMRKLEDVSQTPSAQVLMALRETGLDYSEWILLKSREHKETFRHSSSSATVLKELAREAQVSLKEQLQIEAGDTLTFDQFLKEYLAR